MASQSDADIASATAASLAAQINSRAYMRERKGVAARTEGAAPKLFLGQVAKAVTEQDLYKIFEPFGPIVELVLLRDKFAPPPTSFLQPEQHRGCGFLVYQDKSSADKAIAGVDGKIQLIDRFLQVRYAGAPDLPSTTGECKLFVGMLSKGTTQDQINALFSKFGRVTEVFILRDGMGHSKGCCFVKMQNKDEADIALLALNEMYQDVGAPQKLQVKYADNKKDKQVRAGAGNVQAYSAAVAHSNALAATSDPYAHLRGSSAAGQQMLAAAGNPYAHLYGAFAAPIAVPGSSAMMYNNSGGYTAPPSGGPGAVASQMLPPGVDSMNTAAPSSSSSSSSAAAAASSSPVASMPPYAAAAVAAAAAAANPITAPPTAYYSQSALGSRARGPPEANIFIYHIPEYFGNAELAGLFASFGTVISAQVFTDKGTGASRGFGFVSYTDGFSAARAITAMDGFQVGNRRLKVGIKKDVGGGGGGGMMMGGMAAGMAGRAYRPY